MGGQQGNLTTQISKCSTQVGKYSARVDKYSTRVGKFITKTDGEEARGGDSCGNNHRNEKEKIDKQCEDAREGGEEMEGGWGRGG